MPADETQKGSAAEQRLRGDIDSGRTGDKVDFPDPAAAPLGTDAEAGGAATNASAASDARKTELAGPRTPRHRDWRYVLPMAGYVLIVAALLALALSG